MHPASDTRYRHGCATARDYVLATQQPDGFWLDKWHASPYYATNYAVSALDHFGGAIGEGAVSQAVEWVLDTQGRDGSWGMWCPTIDETAHAMHLLLSLDPKKDRPEPRLKEALRHGADFLAACWDATPNDSVHMPLWVGKELYAADRIIRALALSVLHRYRLESEPSADPGRRISYTDNGAMP
jgi:squalene cyclase